MREREMRKTVCGILIILMSMGMLTLALNVRQTRALDPPTIEWTKTYGGTDDDVAVSVVRTSDGGYTLAGSTPSFGAGDSDFWLVKTDASGNHEWNQTYGGIDTESGQSVILTSDGGYALTGYTRSFGAGGWDAWLVKTDSSGNMLWNQTYGGTRRDFGNSVLQTSDGGYTIAGQTRSLGAGNSDFWLVKTDSVGNAMWNQTYGGADVDVSYSLVQTVDGGYALAGTTESFGAGNRDFWLVKTDTAGNMLWNQTFGGTDEEWLYSLVQTSDGGYAMAGLTNSSGAGADDFWLVKTDASGNHEWNQTYGGTSWDGAFSSIQTVDGGYALAGYTFSYGDANGDLWFVKTDAAGNAEWNITYGGTEVDAASFVLQTSDGGYALAGFTASFGAGDSDFWLIKLAEAAPPPVGVPEFDLSMVIMTSVLLCAWLLTLSEMKRRRKLPQSYS